MSLHYSIAPGTTRLTSIRMGMRGCEHNHNNMKEKLQHIFGEDRAVSPVVGVALLIAMTVILAAIIAAVVLGLGSNPAESPQATFDFEQDGDDLHITHNGGDVLEGGEIEIQYVDSNGAEQTEEITEDWSVGETETIDVDSDTTVRIVWHDSDSSTTSTLTTYQVP